MSPLAADIGQGTWAGFQVGPQRLSTQDRAVCHEPSLVCCLQSRRLSLIPMSSCSQTFALSWLLPPLPAALLSPFLTSVFLAVPERSCGSLGASGTWIKASPLSLAETGSDCPEGLSVRGRALFSQTPHTLWLSESRFWTLGKRKGPCTPSGRNLLRVASTQPIPSTTRLGSGPVRPGQ